MIAHGLALGGLALRDLHPGWLPPSARPLLDPARARLAPRRTLRRLLREREPDAFIRLCLCDEKACRDWAFALGPPLPPLQPMVLRLGAARLAGALRRTITGAAVRRVREVLGPERERALRAADSPAPSALDHAEYDAALSDPAADLAAVLARAGTRELLAQARRVDACLGARLRLVFAPADGEPVAEPPVLPTSGFDPRAYFDARDAEPAPC